MMPVEYLPGARRDFDESFDWYWSWRSHTPNDVPVFGAAERSAALADVTHVSSNSGIRTMQVQLPLDQMTIADKLEVMESLWADLSRRPGELPSPDWHQDVLLERKRLVEQDQLQVLDWEQAITELREEVRGNSPA